MKGSLIERINSIKQKEIERKKNNSDKQEGNSSFCEYSKEDEDEKDIYLPVSKINTTPTPNTMLRSALFGVVKRGSREYEKKILKATLKDYTVRYTGQKLDQADLDVWLECIRRSQNTPLGVTVKFNTCDFLRAIKRNTGKSDYDWLEDSLTRMKATAVELSDGHYSYIGSIIHDVYRDLNTKEWCLILNRNICSCFNHDTWTSLDNTIRLKLKGKPLTQWLHGFYSSHRKPFPMKVRTLKELCGSETKELYKFRQTLKKSIMELSLVTGWDFHIDMTDKVIIKK